MISDNNSGVGPSGIFSRHARGKRKKEIEVGKIKKKKEHKRKKTLAEQMADGQGN